ncbi:sterol uptake control protein 2 [Echria macrotheca]|uniref:Sterol uptake control protein 2 n=1 Tax=Echria macrotheca TaxID=438768 RepID=A0AAJ0B2Z5_9PEZI|nr:sterol uptake control protein 2 [Echria macrotheca]
MVYCGKPSKGCSHCRERKIRCDQREPGCGQCEKRQQECPGYRNLVDLMFRDESSHVIKKAKAKARRKGHLIIEPDSSPDLRNRLSLTPEPRGKALSLVVPRSRPQTPSSPGQHSVWSHDDSIMSPESGSWPVTPAMALLYNLAPTCQERGTAYFFSRYVTMEETACHQRFDFLYEIWKPVSTTRDREVDGVLASMTAVGLMGIAIMTQSRDMMEAAQKSYGTALRLMNHALADPAEAIKDTTMLSVLILGVFEMMTENIPRTKTIEAFQEHVNGAAALAMMRGPAQFQTSAGKRMFSMLCQRVVISCIQRAMPVPEPIVQLFHEMNKANSPTDPSVWITAMTFEGLQIRYDIKRGAMTDPEVIVETLISLEERYESLLMQLPPEWHYRTFKLSRHHPAVFNGFCHLYPSLWHATAWNSLRTTRIIILETILSEIYLESQSFSSRLSSPRYTEEFTKAKRKLKRLVHDTIASVPQHLGLVNPDDGSIESLNPAAPPISSVEVRETPSPPTSPSARSDSVSTAGYSPPELKGQPCGLTIHDVMGARDAEDEAHRYMLLASATSTVVWPLYIVAMSSACTDDVKSYSIDRLRTLYMETGIRQADAIANLLVEHETSWEWLETPMRPMDVLSPMIKFEDYDYALQLEGLHHMERDSLLLV